MAFDSVTELFEKLWFNVPEMGYPPHEVDLQTETSINRETTNMSKDCQVLTADPATQAVLTLSLIHI